MAIRPAPARPATTGGPKPGSKYTEVETVSLQDMIADATAQEVNDTLQKDETTEPPADTGTTPPDNTPPPDPDPEPTKVTLRILTTAGTYTAFPGSPNPYTTDNTGDQGSLWRRSACDSR